MRPNWFLYLVLFDLVKLESHHRRGSVGGRDSGVVFCPIIFKAIFYWDWKLLLIQQLPTLGRGYNIYGHQLLDRDTWGYY